MKMDLVKMFAPYTSADESADIPVKTQSNSTVRQFENKM